MALFRYTELACATIGARVMTLRVLPPRMWLGYRPATLRRQMAALGTGNPDVAARATVNCAVQMATWLQETTARKKRTTDALTLVQAIARIHAATATA